MKICFFLLTFPAWSLLVQPLIYSYLFIFNSSSGTNNFVTKQLVVRVVKVLRIFLLAAFIMEGLTGNMAPGRL